MDQNKCVIIIVWEVTKKGRRINRFLFMDLIAQMNQYVITNQLQLPPHETAPMNGSHLNIIILTKLLFNANILPLDPFMIEKQYTDHGDKNS